MYFQAEAQRACAGSESERVKWFQGFCLYRGVILWKGNDCGRSRVGWAEMELQIWPGLWPNRESLLSGPRLPARYQQLPPEIWLCQETPLLAVGRRIVETEVSFSSLIYFLFLRGTFAVLTKQCKWGEVWRHNFESLQCFMRMNEITRTRVCTEAGTLHPFRVQICEEQSDGRSSPG